MRQAIIIILFLISFLEGFAQLLNNNIVVVSKDGKKFTLYVNGEKINSRPEADVKAFNVNEGWCKLRAEFEDGRSVVTDSIHIKAYTKNNNKEITYAISEQNKRGSGKFVFVSMGDLSGPQVPPVPPPPVDSPVLDNAVYGNLYKAVNGKPQFFYNYIDSLKKCSIELNDLDIKIGINLITKTNDIQNRFNYLENTVEKNCYTTDRVIQLLNLSDIELDKLKLAKKAFYHLTDKNNAAKLKSVFKFKSVGEDFDLFLKEVANAEHQQRLNCKEAVGETQLQDIISGIKKGQYEPDRLKIAKEKVVNNCFSTAQIDKLLQLFTHDREKLELAKSSYAVTIDKENYEKLADNFQFSENKKDFLNFIEK